MAYLTAGKISEILEGMHFTQPYEAYKTVLEQVAAAIAADSSPMKLGTKAMAVLRVAAAVKDAETVTIGADVYEVDTRATEHITAGRIRLNLSGGGTTKMQGTLTIPTQPTAGDTFTIGSKVFTIVPQGTADADGQVNRGTDLATAQAAIVAAINGTDGYNTAHAQVTAGAFAVNVSTIEALSGGIATIATTETFTAVGNVFDAATLGTAQAGVDPTADEFSTAFEAAVNASGTELVTAVKVSANEVLIFRDSVGVNTTSLAETLAGTNNAWDTSALRAGAAAAVLQVVCLTRVPNAAEVALGNMHFPLAVKPNGVLVEVRVTADGTAKAWDGKAAIKGTTNPYIQIDNTGNTDWAATDTVYVYAFV